MAPVSPKGAALEELVRAFYARQGFVALRSVTIRFEEEEVTDVDVWLFGKQGAGTRTRTLVDVKDKRSPKAFERILWARGMQLALGCDRSIVATTDNSAKVSRFAQQQRVNLLHAGFLRNLESFKDASERLSLEDFVKNIQKYPHHKQDGDWLLHIADAKSAIVSLAPYPAFNKAISAFRFFAERAATRAQHREQALRGAYFSASLACIALDFALERLSFDNRRTRYNALHNGITYGDAGDGRVKNTIDKVLMLVEQGVNNGPVLARQARDAFSELFNTVRADIIAEFFAEEGTNAILFKAAHELEMRAHMRSRADLTRLSVEGKSVIGLFADFIQAKRPALLSNEFVEDDSPAKSTSLSLAGATGVQPTAPAPENNSTAVKPEEGGTSLEPQPPGIDSKLL